MSESSPSTPISTSEPMEVPELRFRQQGPLPDPFPKELVMTGFRCLMRKLYSNDSGLAGVSAQEPFTSSTVVIDKISNLNGIISNHELFSEFLPRLGRQLDILSRLLDVEDFQNNPESALNLLLEFQPEFDNNVTQITSAVALICPRPLHTSDRADDQQLRELKSYWLNKLAIYFLGLDLYIYWTCHWACNHMQRLNLCMINKFADDGDSGPPMFLIRPARSLINTTINFISRSELDDVKEDWVRAVRSMNEQLNKAIVGLGRLSGLVNIIPRYRVQHIFHVPIVDLTELLMTMIKLSRIFFNKLLGSEMNRKSSSGCTEMNSKQLKCLCASAEQVAADLDKLENILYGAETDAATDLIRTGEWNLTRVAESLASRFEAPMILILLYIVHPMPETHLALNNYKSWFATWNTQFTLVINRFKYFAKLPT
ncbi:hypothetical protein PSTG_11831 [Puccinia striiformis f. sp. tritici PST-78]|uniref:Uncharacterized protein n=1 Tax=Puccinia striiformis f. sp. tritici PST-78 TaxID=1165861 RepID=A0A0L0V685_9BASI|nr:hypothetical protein PSTG_11831 [Puccinia striiformis f. sp. tritici PST-78]